MSGAGQPNGTHEKGKECFAARVGLEAASLTRFLSKMEGKFARLRPPLPEYQKRGVPCGRVRAEQA